MPRITKKELKKLELNAEPKQEVEGEVEVDNNITSTFVQADDEEETEEEENVTTDSTTQHTSNGKGFKAINHSEISKKAEQLIAKRELPKPPGKTVTFSEMQDWLSLLTIEMWDRVIVYLYRDLPVIIRQLSSSENPKYIDVYHEPFTEEQVIETHGGGKYSLWVNDTDVPKGKNGNLFRAKLTVSMSQYQPKLIYEELDINCKDNMGYLQWLKAKGILDERGKVMDISKAQSGGSNSGDMVALFKEFSTFFTKLSADQQNNVKKQLVGEEGGLGKAIGDILLEKMKQEDPNKMINTLVALMNAVKPQANGSSNSSEISMMERVIQMQSDHNKAMIELMRERNSGKEEKEDTFSALDKMLDVMEKLGFSRRGGGSNKSGWEIGLELAREVAGPVFNMVSNIIAAKASGNPGVKPIITQVANNGLQGMGVDDNNNMQQSEQPKVAGALPMAELMPYLQQAAPIILMQLNQGKQGWEFADSLVGMYGAGIHAKISSYGVDGIISVMKSMPEFWNPVSTTFGEAHMQKWVNDFIHYEEVIAELEDDSEGEEKEK